MLYKNSVNNEAKIRFKVFKRESKKEEEELKVQESF